MLRSRQTDHHQPEGQCLDQDNRSSSTRKLMLRSRQTNYSQPEGRCLNQGKDIPWGELQGRLTRVTTYWGESSRETYWGNHLLGHPARNHVEKKLTQGVVIGFAED